jgi:hypothetical protein
VRSFRERSALSSVHGVDPGRAARGPSKPCSVQRRLGSRSAEGGCKREGRSIAVAPAAVGSVAPSSRPQCVCESPRTGCASDSRCARGERGRLAAGARARPRHRAGLGQSTHGGGSRRQVMTGFRSPPFPHIPDLEPVSLAGRRTRRWPKSARDRFWTRCSMRVERKVVVGAGAS